MIKVAIIDIIGLAYDGNTLQKRGLGGSESAVILMAKELAKLNFSVTVYNNCIDREASEGIYENVEYIDLSNLNKNPKIFDIVICSRNLIPFLPEKYENDFTPRPSYFKNIVSSAKLKIIWMHDTFCQGADHVLEELLVEKHIDEVFTLSDFHTTYFGTCDHGGKRMYEVLKNKIFMTRNGIVRHIKEVSIEEKDPNLFVYNASVTKGMLPLVYEIWPRVKHYIPSAKLKVIGGYYRFREDAEPDDQEKKWREMVKDERFKQFDVEFTGIIRQDTIAEILSKASFMLYPSSFPETFGISSLESLCYNTPLITSRFGALEETAIETACYLLDYAIEPNGLFPKIDLGKQVDKFVEMTVQAHNNRYLYLQKANYCNIVHDICEWKTIALQWKQHFYKKLGEFLSAEEYRKVSYINHRVKKIFGRRFTNKEEMIIPAKSGEKRIVVISPFFNAENYIEKCINSVAQQDYDNYIHILIDDCSTDNSFEVALKAIQNLPEKIQLKFALSKNLVNLGAVYNQISTIRGCLDDDIIMLLDGDDWFINDNTIFQQYNTIYDDAEFTYGSCWSIVDNIPLISQEYPEKIKQTRAYRKHLFNWGIPYTHLRTFKKFLINNVSDNSFKDREGNWYKAGGDGSVFYALIEQANPDKIKVIQDIVYNYNDASPYNDYKINNDIQNKNAKEIQEKQPGVPFGVNLNYVDPEIKTQIYKQMSERNKIEEKKEFKQMKKILIAVPTSKYIEVETFKSIYDLIVPEGYETEFQYFYGYQIDQIRNLIAHWIVNGPYDYLFSVDSDIVLPNDSLVKMINQDKDMISGLYIQRKEDQQTPEIYKINEHGLFHMNLIDIPKNETIEIDGCGFGCALIKKSVFTSIEYPHFVYHSAIDHKDTFSEDLDFCVKAKQRGFKIFLDSSIICKHIGTRYFVPNM